MGKIYKGQTALKINLDTKLTEADLVGASGKIKYKGPSSLAGEWDGVIVGTRILKTGTVSLTLVPASCMMKFWTFVTFSDGRTAAGEPIEVQIWVEGT